MLRGLATILCAGLLAAGCSSSAGSPGRDHAGTPEGDAVHEDVASGDTAIGSDAPEPDAAPDGEVAPPKPCGDGACADDEDGESCPVDCAGGTSADCLKGSCPDEMTDCYASPGCTVVLSCLLQCTTDACAQSCAGLGDPDGLALMIEAVRCGQTAGCFAEPDPCGDGVCASDETAASCPADCAGSCLAKSCGDLIDPCEADEDCTALYDCWSGCGDEACRTACYQEGTPAAMQAVQQIEACALAEGCIDGQGPECGDGACNGSETTQTCPDDCGASVECGDGDCDAGESAQTCPEDCDDGPAMCGNGDCEGDEEQTCPSDCGDPTGSCVGKCGQFNPGASCQCDNQCAGFGDCCPDKGAVCDGEDPDCGNDACEPGETPESCSEDCGPPPVGCGSGVCDEGESVDSCAVDCASESALLALCIGAWCGDSQTACQSDAGCKALVSCINGCQSQPCASACASEANAKAMGFYLALAECIEGSGCTEGGPFCGDGLCGADETCPVDCPDQAVCGDGTCSEGEDEASCPGDCTDLDPEQCVQAACKPQVTACVQIFECAQALQCAAQCGGEAQCAAACDDDLPGEPGEAFGTLLGCAIQNGCYGAP